MPNTIEKKERKKIERERLKKRRKELYEGNPHHLVIAKRGSMTLILKMLRKQEKNLPEGTVLRRIQRRKNARRKIGKRLQRRNPSQKRKEYVRSTRRKRNIRNIRKIRSTRNIRKEKKKVAVMIMRSWRENYARKLLNP